MISLLLSLLLIIFVLPLSLSFLDRGTVTLEGAEEAMRSSDPLAGRPVTDGGWTSIGRTARFNYHNRYLSFSSPARGNRCLRVQLTRKKCPPLCGSAMAGGERKEEERKKERKKGRRDELGGESRRRRRRRKDIYTWSCARAYLHAVCAEYVRRGVGILSIGSPSE